MWREVRGSAWCDALSLAPGGPILARGGARDRFGMAGGAAGAACMLMSAGRVTAHRRRGFGARRSRARRSQRGAQERAGRAGEGRSSQGLAPPPGPGSSWGAGPADYAGGARCPQPREVSALWRRRSGRGSLARGVRVAVLKEQLPAFPGPWSPSRPVALRLVQPRSPGDARRVRRPGLSRAHGGGQEDQNFADGQHPGVRGHHSLLCVLPPSGSFRGAGAGRARHGPPDAQSALQGECSSRPRGHPAALGPFGGGGLQSAEW